MKGRSRRPAALCFPESSGRSEVNERLRKSLTAFARREPNGQTAEEAVFVEYYRLASIAKHVLSSRSIGVEDFDDAVQDGAVKLLSWIRKVKANYRKGQRVPEQVVPLLLRMARNAAYDVLRRRARLINQMFPLSELEAGLA